jgi:predicted permease
MTQDVRHTLRTWRRTPVLALAAIFTLSLGVGANTAVFSVVHAVLFRPLPYPSPDRLVELFEQSPENAGFRASALNYLTWADRAKSFDALAAFQESAFTVSGDADAERVAGALVSASLFRVLGVAPIAGRALRADDERPGGPRVAIVARSFWQRRYGGDPLIVGKTISLDGERHEIVGVVPDTFHEVGRAQVSAIEAGQLFVPLRIDPARESRGNHVLRVVGRLRPGVPLEQARAEMSTIASAMGQEFPQTNKGWGARLDRIDDSMLDEGVRPSLLLLLAAVAVVMLIVCANVSNLLLAKAMGRRRELALRIALGANRTRLVRQLFTESVCLAMVSGICGIAVATLTIGALRSLLPPTLPRLDGVQIDVVVFAFGLGVAAVSGVLFGVLPAIRVSSVDPLTALGQSGRGIAGSSRSKMRQGLVAAQVALATMLLAGAILLVQSFVRLERVAVGFTSDGVLTARISLPRTQYPDDERASQFYRQLLQTIGTDPGVEAAAVGTSVPFGTGVRRSVGVRAVSGPPAAGTGTVAAGESTRSLTEHIVSGDYFRTLTIQVVTGRVFDERDRAGAPPVVIVSQAAARQLWPGMNPIGQLLERDGRPHEVVGVVGDVRGADGRGQRGGGLDRLPREALYLPATQFPQRTMTVLLRTAGEPSSLVPRLRAALRNTDSTIPLAQARTLDDWLTDAVANPRLTTMIGGAFAAIAVLLAAIGIYGVVAYAVGQRTPEIGLRMAVGATRRHVLTLVLRDVLMSAAIGTMLGLGGAALVNKVLGTLLFEVRPDDPITFIVAAMLLAIVSLVACYLPARRATRVDPLIALRCD